MKKPILILSALSAILFLSFIFKNDVKEWEMKEYYFVLLTKGANRTQDSASVANIQEAHIANINRLANEGKLSIAGPFGDDGDWRGIFIMNAKSMEEAKQWCETDPAINAGRLKYEIHPWWGAKGSELQ